MNEEKFQDQLRRKWKARNEFITLPPQKVYRLLAVHNVLIHEFEQWITQQHDIAAKAKVLCLGCHHGRILSRIDKERGIKGYYVDQSPRLMQSAIHLYPHFSYKLLEPEHIPYKSRKVNYAIVAVPFQSLYHKSAITAELRRVLKKQGVIYLYDRVGQSLSSVIEANGLYIEEKINYKLITIYRVKALEDKRFI
ncbi:class I SAM-dependent methyltransferase [Macrococcus equipercicus]|uniref:Class I SAM-dependent methyltransferase n=1 Tax=Macrococcus equipercicus TaxID=69967 RepID=A0A9Q9F2M6_9STAP|nr:class I SAM-dependent methyltransferase [Macrococcus equipercicus]KAA1042695.1 class I SAM-dependent methyltransferase [Macrococcus equipercicus]UTH14561.1 class I SAM-dependent methyltransferase [Macrococcus equipercicus]